ncbi:TPA: hypothetical protein ACMDS2_004837, partial [Vibrio parahaemolyticus]
MNTEKTYRDHSATQTLLLNSESFSPRSIPERNISPKPIMQPTPSWKNESGTKTQSDIFISLI